MAGPPIPGDPRPARACMLGDDCTCTDPDATWDLCRHRAIVDKTIEPGVAYVVPILPRRPHESFLEWRLRCADAAVKIVNIAPPPADHAAHLSDLATENNLYAFGAFEPAEAAERFAALQADIARAGRLRSRG